MPCICFVLHMREWGDVSSTHKFDSSQCFHDATRQLEHDGQVQPQESITEKERLILAMALQYIDEK